MAIALGVAAWPAPLEPSARPQPPSAADARASADAREAVRPEPVGLPASGASDAATRAAAAELAKRIEAKLPNAPEAIHARPAALLSRSDALPASSQP